MISAIKSFYKNYFNFSGRSTRSEYWYFMLANIIIAFILGFIMGIGVALDGGDKGVFTFIFGIPYAIYLLSIIIPSYALLVRRFHDIGKSGWWILICILLNFICGIGSIIMLVFCCMDSVPDNQYGPNPKTMNFNPYGNPNNGMYNQYNNNPYNQNGPYNNGPY